MAFEARGWGMGWTWRSTRGYTLAELMIVLCVAGILYALLSPVWTGYVTHVRVRGAANRVAGDLAYLRALAVNRGHAAVLVLEPSADCRVSHRGRLAGHRYRVYSRSEPGVALRTVDLRIDAARLCMEMNGTDSLVFNSRGLLAGFNNRTIWLHQADRADSLTVSVVGRVRRRY